MKKLLTLLVVCVSFSLMLSAENRTINFNGKSYEDQELNLQKVTITNVTQNWTVTLTEQFSLEVESTNGQNENGGGDDNGGENGGGDDNGGGDNGGGDNGGGEDQAIGEIYWNDGTLQLSGKNPFDGTTHVKLNLDRADNVRIGIIDISGRLIYHTSARLESGEWFFNVSVQMPQLCFMTVATSQKASSIKLMNTGFAPANDVSILSSRPYTPRHYAFGTKTYQCKEGDEMQFKAWTIQGGVKYGDEREGTWSDENQTITFRFSLLPDATSIKPQSGMYLGILGFNKNYVEFPITRMNKASVRKECKSWIDERTKENNTDLYYTEWAALNKLQEFRAPEDLENVAIITFTDGLDKGSYFKIDDFKKDGNNSKLIDSIQYRLKYDSVNHHPIDAYAIGVRGGDVNDDNLDAFDQTLVSLVKDNENSFKVENIQEVDAKFKAIAANLHKVNTISDVILMATREDVGTLISWTFDLNKDYVDKWNVGVNGITESQLYISGKLGIDDNFNWYLSDIECSGLTYAVADKEKLDTVYGIYLEDAEMIKFTFKNVRDLSDNAITNISLLQEWVRSDAAKNWGLNSEYSRDNNPTPEIIDKSAVIMLVLDFSESLGESGFSQLKSATKNFIDIVTAELKDDEYDDTYQSISISQARSMALGLDDGEETPDLYRIEQAWATNVNINTSLGHASFELVSFQKDPDGFSDYIDCNELYNGKDGWFSSVGEIVEGDSIQVVAKIKNNSGATQLESGYVEKINRMKVYIKNPFDTGVWEEMTRYITGSNAGNYVYYGTWYNKDFVIAWDDTADEHTSIITKEEITIKNVSEGNYAIFVYDPNKGTMTVSRYY